jgi:hypothetical protein
MNAGHAMQLSRTELSIAFDLADELRDLRRDLEFTSGDRAAKTLAKTDGLRLTLVLLKPVHP